MAQKVVIKHKFWKEISVFLKHYKRNVIIAVICSLITGIGVALQPLVIKYIVDSGIDGKPFMGNVYEDFDSKITFIAICVIFYLLISAMRIAFWRIGLNQSLKVIEGTLFELRSKLFNHIQKLCMRFYDKTPSGKIFNYIMGSPMGNVKTFLNSVIMNIPYQIVSFVISLVALLSYDWILTIILVVTAGLMLLINVLAREKIKAASKTYIDTETQTSTYVSDMLHGMDAVKYYSIEDRTISKFDEYLSTLKNKGMKYEFQRELETMKPEFAQNLGTAVVYFIGALACIRGRISVGVLYAFLSSMSTILSTFNSWLSLVLTKNNAEVSLDKIFTMMDENTSTPEIDAEHEHDLERDHEFALAHNIPCIEFEHVKFAYDTKPVFSDFSCKINYNESIALVGSSGSGKSTLTKLLLRLYEIDSGSIKLHGTDIKNFKGHVLRDSFGVVPQSPYIFHDTVWNNICVSNPDATEDEVKLAMKIARVDEFVNELPDGINTMIGDGALALSGGQRQRIAIARAVLKKTDFLIFDEATSALDNISEKHIQEAMEDLMKTHTVIIIAHRLSTVKNADRILVFDNGYIVQEGKFDYLANTPGIFRDMLDSANHSDTLNEDAVS